MNREFGGNFQKRKQLAAEFVANTSFGYY